MKILVAGGGASGFMAAITAAERWPHHTVIIAEKSHRVLSKVLISGGGRCNVTHRPLDIHDFSDQYPRGKRFLKKVLHEFGAADAIQWFESRGVRLKTEVDGRVFPASDDSASIAGCLEGEARRLGIQVLLKKGLDSFEKVDSGFQVHFSDGTKEVFDRIILATGGFPKSSSYDFLREAGIAIKEPLPSLFTFNSPGNPISKLMGVSVPFAQVKIGGTKLVHHGPLLITHWGFSGPAVLKLSAFGAELLAEMKYEFNVEIRWCNDITREECRAMWLGWRDKKVKTLIANHSGLNLPERLWNFLVEEAQISDKTRWADIGNKGIDSLLNQVFSNIHAIKGKTTFKEEFVTCGGVCLDKVDHRTMEYKNIPGLYFAGELLDVDGVTGGFNFQNAWTTGFIAGRSVGQNYSSVRL
ncbi:MAG: NAD(P)/FAD-dependent oxidoreductase [Saprospiraceae bacterium]|nr:NAD(P)/FAD-dependent oxidoreductase [Saprospiraceae bacterium]MBX7179363.1 NAD(P)/FAD-dependent oxidoreductase [Saprospiraceae bacterium]MCB0591009.1 NAD(P)/FAD-dependent oxidoreductase [Saprospiraceae bacterium]MCO5282942.1 NAD(P)/FAD-dependent oxidoreductase [Saprospiraceae bacterium]MCO6469633.1 NAD(P)/FAD-dependent oxidoreductase [Saprospiraceae bacterium]